MKRKYLYRLIIEEVHYRKAVSKILSMNSYLRIREFSSYILCNSTKCELIYLIRKIQMHFIKLLKLACVYLISFLQ